MLVSRTQSALEALQSEYGSEKVAVLPGDMSDASLPEKAVALANEKWGRLDSLIINHGSLDPVKKVADTSAEEWRKGFDVNVFSAVGLVRTYSVLVSFICSVSQSIIAKFKDRSICGCFENASSPLVHSKA